MDLKQEIGKLIALQEVDSRIYALKRTKEDKPQEIVKLKKLFEEKTQILKSAEERLKQTQLKRNEREVDLAAKEESIRKAKTQLFSLKTNKEYHAKLTEIETMKADVSVIEEDILKMFEEVDLLTNDVAVQKSKFQEEDAAFKAREKTVKEEINLIDKEIKELEDTKRIRKDGVDGKILSVYERLVKTRNGLAIVPVENENCGACHIKVTAQTINEIKMYDTLIFCGNCVRALYVREDISTC